jgi:hypothetical protein
MGGKEDKNRHRERQRGFVVAELPTLEPGASREWNDEETLEPPWTRFPLPLPPVSASPPSPFTSVYREVLWLGSGSGSGSGSRSRGPDFRSAFPLCRSCSCSVLLGLWLSAPPSAALSPAPECHHYGIEQSLLQTAQDSVRATTAPAPRADSDSESESARLAAQAPSQEFDLLI